MMLLALAASALALTSTLLLLHIPQNEEEQQVASLENENSGFLSEATLHVIPVFPRARAQDIEDLEIYPETSDLIMKAGDWFNQGANGKRVIFSGVSENRPEVLTPKFSEEDEPSEQKVPTENWRHDCSELVNLAATTGAALGPKKVVVLLVEKTWKCPFVGLAGWRSNWAIITGWDTDRMKFNYYTLIHELGHVLGLPHARRYQCTASVGIYEKPSTLSKCEIAEYGDTSDPMGSTIDRMSPGFNAFNRYLLGWNDPPKKIDGPGIYRVNIPVATSGKSGYVEIPGGFLISYRAPNGEPNDIDRKLDVDPYIGDVSGVYLHRKASDKDDGSTYPIQLPFRKMQSSGKVGDHYVSEESNVAFLIADIVKGKRAEVIIHVGSDEKPVKDIWGPVPILLTMQDLRGRYIQAQWDAFDPSGIEEAYVVVDGQRQESWLSGAIVLPYANDPQEMYFVAIDKQGNRTASKKYIIPAYPG